MNNGKVKASEVYRLAAKIISEDRRIGIWERTPCCPAIHTAAHELGAYRSWHRLRDDFARIFMPKTKATYDLWFGNTKVVENQDRRVLALLFMAEMVKGDDA